MLPLCNHNIKLDPLHHIPPYLPPQAQSNEAGEGAVRYRRVEINPHKVISTIVTKFLDSYRIVSDHFKIFKCVWLLWISNSPQ